jgi:aspartate racemase
MIHERSRTRHIGILACSSEGAALCYRTICLEGASLLGPFGHPEISIHTHPLSRYVAHLSAGDWPGVAELMRVSAEKLAAAGADFLICPDNTIHAALPFLGGELPLPLLHIAEVVSDHAAGRGLRRVGLLGTAYLVESDVYPDKLAARGVQLVRPTPSERAEIHRVIMDELVRGITSQHAIEVLQGVMNRMKQDGCDGAILGCTEIPLVIDDTNAPLPTLDSTRLLARAALWRAVTTADAS